MDFQLANGKTLTIKGGRFLVDVTKSEIIVEPLVAYQQAQKPVDTSIEQFVLDNNTPSYMKEKESKVVKLSELEKSTSDHDEIAEIGQKAFKRFLTKWSEGFGDENAEQPDRADLMNKTMSDYSLHIIRYVRSVGGLTSATMRAFPVADFTQTPYRRKMRLLAENMAQVSSILCPPLSELLEYPFLIDLQQHSIGEYDDQ